MPTEKSLLRFYGICFCFIALLLAFIGRLIFIQLYHSDYLTKLALKQHTLYFTLSPQRGIIYDCNYKPLVTNIRTYSLFAVPGEIKDKHRVAEILHRVLGLDRTFTLSRLSVKRHFIWLKRKLSDKQANEIRQLGIDGLLLRKEYRRSYPNGTLAAHIVGFTDIDNQGLEGIERSYNLALEGEPGYAFFVRDAHQSPLRLENSDKLPVDGHNIVLTIDLVIQYIVESTLDEAFKKYHAKGASVVVMDPSTGEILALANRPTFDPNRPQSFGEDKRRNRAVCDFFEPGSVFKIVAAAAALEEGTANESDRIFCENGKYRVASHILHDHRPHGWLTFSEVVQQSSNIGVTKIAQKLGLPTIYRYAKLFGFGALTRVQLPGETAGMLKPVSAYSKISIGAVPIGQEVAVTTVQLASAISVIANGGMRLKPTIIKEVTDIHGELIDVVKPELIKRAISAQTSKRLRKILQGVIDSGTAKLAKSDTYAFAGKTGTAQKIEPTGGYSHSIFYASFIGFAPVDEPRIAIAVVFDEPYPYYGGVVAAPLFKQIAEKTLKYLEIEERLHPSLTELADVR